MATSTPTKDDHRAAIKPTKMAIFARLGSRPIPRVARMMDEARELGYEALFLSGRREEGLAEEEVYSGHQVKRIGPFFPLLNGRAGWLYVRSVLKYNFALWQELRRKKPSLVHCSDIETMPAGVLYRWSSGARLIYNIHDNLAQRYAIPAWAQSILNFFEGVAVRFSSLTLVPEAFRRDALPAWSRSKVSVVRNTPNDPGIKAPPAKLIPIRLFFGGWLDTGRGLLQLLELVRENEDFELKLAGEGSPELVSLIRDTPRTEHLGFITHEEIMRETAAAHFVTALYDPARPINRYAASNKLAEALACGRPVLVNSEMMITEALSEHDCLVKLAYADVEKLAPGLMRDQIKDGGARYLAKCHNARVAFDDMYAWEHAKAAMVQALLGKTG